jgi:glycosyltransferase involved in cell wall biosynthesis
MKTICFFTRLFYPHIGGVEKHVLEISKILVRQGFEIIIISEKTPGAKLKAKNIHHYQIPIKSKGWFKKFEIWTWLFSHRNLFRQSDIVHCHDVFFWYFPFRFFYPKKPVYTTFHGYESYPVRKKAIIVRKVSEKLSFGSICIGDFMKKWYGAKPNIVMYGGVSNMQENKPNESPSALFVGRLDTQTSIVQYSQAVNLITKKIPDFVFGIAGEGELRSVVKNNKWKKYGAVKNPQSLFRTYRFAFVSRYLSILEAFASRRLVFAFFDNPLKKDYLYKSPFAKYMVVANSAQELSEKILYFLKHKNVENVLIEKAYQWVEKQTWEKAAGQYLKLWRNSLTAE